MAQTNVLEMDISRNDLNTVSFDEDFDIILKSKDKIVYLFSASDTIILNGIFGIVSPNESTVYTADYEVTTDSSLIRSYTIEGKLKDSIYISHHVTGLTASREGFIYVTTKSELYRVYVERKDVEKIHEGAEFTSVHELSNGNIAISGGGSNYILSPTGVLVKEIIAPHRSFGKLNYSKDLFLILQEYSDGSYIDVYSENGKMFEQFKYTHEGKSPISTRRSSTPTLTASFVDFDVSPNGKILLAKDQFENVYLVNRKGKAKRVYESSSKWSFLTFINESTFIYYDTNSNQIIKKKIK